ncbi:Major facilitator superfamily domain general substrate transporter [Penicillium malachiteum]|uniref:Major facilitator superfamily domain general substrate transporter n=1 Tax=Penicillium malachiteum TaxID=1324776 RepID=A0AAD6HF26_9EURO|nr:Major facilitator superfamily domain general substrate transporter [Penicillium malachiteum]
MQSFLEQRRIYKQLERQIVIKRESNNAWTHERRYWYPEEGGIQSEEQYPDDGVAAERRREHGQRTMISGPALEPRHHVRGHLGREQDIERQDCHPELNTEPFTINTRDAIGTEVDMMLTGVEGQRTTRNMSTYIDGCTTGSDDDEKEKIIIVTYEGDCDPADPHNWSFLSRCATTVLLSLLSAIIIWSSTIDGTAIKNTEKEFHTTFEIETLPTGT